MTKLKEGYRLAWKLFSFPLPPIAKIKTRSLSLQRRTIGAQWFERNACKLKDYFMAPILQMNGA